MPARPLRADSDIEELAAHLRVAVLRLGRQLRLQDDGVLSPTSSLSLGRICTSGPTTISELAASEHVSVPTMSNVVGRLEEMGLVTRVRDPDDGRVWQVRATPAGEQYMADNRTRRTEWLAARLHALSAGDVSRLHRALGALQAVTDPGGAPAAS